MHNYKVDFNKDVDIYTALNEMFENRKENSCNLFK